MEEMLGFIIQVRSGSVRLPGKMTKDFWNKKTILELIIEKLQKSFPNINIILATSVNKNDIVFKRIAEKYSVDFFQGSENDVLERFLKTAENFKVEKIIRICADNPFLDMNEMSTLIKNIDEKSDYISFEINNSPSIKTHFGFWAEYVKLDALQKVKLQTKELIFKEHVTNYIYTHPEKFKIKFLNPNPKVNATENVRMTIDTLDDFQTLQEVYKDLHKLYGNDFDIYNIIEFLDNNDLYKQKMKIQIQLNSK